MNCLPSALEHLLVELQDQDLAGATDPILRHLDLITGK